MGSTTLKIPEQFAILDPFSENKEEYIHFKTRLPRKNIHGTYDIGKSYLKTIRIFFASEIRPRLNQWFIKLASATAEELDDLAKIPVNIEVVVEKFALSLKGPKDFLDRIKSETEMSLFPTAESRFAVMYLVEFFCNHYRAFTKSDMYKELPLCLNTKDMQIVDISEPSDSNCLPKFIKITEIMFKSWLGFAPILYQAISHAYVLITESYQRMIVHERKGTYPYNFIKIIEHALTEWLNLFMPDYAKTQQLLDKCKQKVCHSAINLLSDKIYQLVIHDYPDSSETIATLQFCFANSENYARQRILDLLIEKVRSRLLTVEEDTSVILDGYSNCVYALKELDPSCSFMHRVCSEIREFLKRRPDTVRKIIHYITTIKRDQLSQHLYKSSGAIIDEEEFRGTNDEFLSESLENHGRNEQWLPDPPDAPAGKSSHIRQSADVFNMLISVYGSKEIFVKEYRKLLSERLTSFSQFELRYLEVLKQRFNDGELAQCEVMLKDVEESLKMDIIVADTQEVPITSTIVSSHFWPLPELDKNVDVPTVLEEGLNFYSDKYLQSKVTRKLNWLKSWGWTEVELTLGNITTTKFITNQHAAILYLYTEKESWSPSEVASRFGITKSVAKRRLEWWGNQGLVVQSLPNGATSEVWSLVENPTILYANAQQGADVSDDEEGAAIEDVADAADALEAFWMYTKNYIAQNENVKAERIHKIFKMFASPSAQSPSLEVVNTFLFRKVKQNLLTFQAGAFRVVKDVTK